MLLKQNSFLPPIINNFEQIDEKYKYNSFEVKLFPSKEKKKTNKTMYSSRRWGTIVRIGQRTAKSKNSFPRRFYSKATWRIDKQLTWRGATPRDTTHATAARLPKNPLVSRWLRPWKMVCALSRFRRRP